MTRLLAGLLRSGLGLALITALLLGTAPGSARADSTQLCRAGTAIAFAPLDVALSPLISARDLYYGLEGIDDDPLFVKFFFSPVGYLWLNMMQVFGGITRTLSGVVDIVPGVMNLFGGESEKSIYAPLENSWALYSGDWGPCPVKIGLSHQDVQMN